ncbi:MAG: hypothetical protein KGH84_08570 [Paracoccaceae bacterium]|nr:hypothetical protein [Paracoccaceae bacterium]
MPRQNRVTPEGEILAVAARGMFMGNRGCLHDAGGNLGAARWRHPHWVCCVLAFKGRKRALMQPRRYTELFFLDEAVAMAAGHRPCAECRRAEYEQFRAAFPGGPLAAPEMDRVLHAARVLPRHQQVFVSDISALPDGAYVKFQHRNEALLVHGTHLLPYTPEGYGVALARPPSGSVKVLTPHPTVAALAAGYRPILHTSAG